MSHESPADPSTKFFLGFGMAVEKFALLVRLLQDVNFSCFFQML